MGDLPLSIGLIIAFAIFGVLIALAAIVAALVV